MDTRLRVHVHTMGGYKVLVYIVQATYTIALSWFI